MTAKSARPSSSRTLSYLAAPRKQGEAEITTAVFVRDVSSRICVVDIFSTSWIYRDSISLYWYKFAVVTAYGAKLLGDSGHYVRPTRHALALRSVKTYCKPLQGCWGGTEFISTFPIIFWGGYMWEDGWVCFCGYGGKISSNLPSSRQVVREFVLGRHDQGIL